VQPPSPYFVEIEYQIKLADVAEELIQHFHEEMHRLQICKLVVVRVYTRAEEQPGIPPVDDLTAATKLDEVGLVFLVARRNKAVNLAFELDLLVVVVRAIPLRKARLASDPRVSGVWQQW